MALPSVHRDRSADWPASDDRAAGPAPRSIPIFLPSAILVLLREVNCDGRELGSRLAELGFQPAHRLLVEAVLGAMEREGLLRSHRLGGGRPGPLVYAITAAGDDYLREVSPLLRRHLETLGAMLDVYHPPPRPTL